MAESGIQSDIQDEITCSIHQETFVSPMVLKCLHTFCKEDINKLKDYAGNIQCPLCKSRSKASEAKPDFRMKRMIEIHEKFQDESPVKTLPSSSSKTCEFCENQPFTKECCQCKMRFCDACCKGHLKMPYSKHHVVKDLDTLVKEAKNQLEIRISEIQRVNETSTKSQESWTQYADELLQLRSKITKEMSSSKTAYKKEVEKYFETLQVQANDEIDSELDVSKKNAKSFKDFKKNSERSRKLLQKLLNDEDREKLLDNSFLNSVIQQSQKATDAKPNSPDRPKEKMWMKLISHSDPHQLLSDIKISSSKDSARKKNQEENDLSASASGENISTSGSSRLARFFGPQARQEADLASAQALESSQIPKCLADFKSFVLERDEFFTSNSKPKAITKVGTDIWIVLDDGTIEILDRHGIWLLSICLSKLLEGKRARHRAVSVCATKAEWYGGPDIYVACSRRLLDSIFGSVTILPGLLKMSCSGDILQVLSTNDYCYVSVCSDYVCALRGTIIEVIDVFSRRDCGQCLRTINLQRGHNSLLAFDGLIYLTNWSRGPGYHEVVEYRKVANCDDFTMYFRGRFEDACLDEPFVCDVDAERKVLVADKNNSRLLYVENLRTMNKLITNKDIYKPIDAMFMPETGSIYVICENDCVIYRLHKHEATPQPRKPDLRYQRGCTTFYYD